jgi:hypothetical protein
MNKNTLIGILVVVIVLVGGYAIWKGTAKQSSPVQNSTSIDASQTKNTKEVSSQDSTPSTVKASVITIDPKNPTVSTYTSYALGVTFQYKNTTSSEQWVNQQGISSCPPSGAGCTKKIVQSPVPPPIEKANDIIFDGGKQPWATLFVAVFGFGSNSSITQAIQNVQGYSATNCHIVATGDKYRIVSNPGLPAVEMASGQDSAYCGDYAAGYFTPLSGSTSKVLFVSNTQYVPGTVAPDGTSVVSTFKAI